MESLRITILSYRDQQNISITNNCLKYIFEEPTKKEKR